MRQAIAIVAPRVELHSIMPIVDGHGGGRRGMGGTTNLKVGGLYIEGCTGGQYSKNTQIWQMWGVDDPQILFWWRPGVDINEINKIKSKF